MLDVAVVVVVVVVSVGVKFAAADLAAQAVVQSNGAWYKGSLTVGFAQQN